MITIDPAYLETFLVWLTGNDKYRSVSIPYEVGVAIENANVIRLCHVEWIGEDKRHGVVWWLDTWLERQKPKEKPRLSGIDIAKQITAAIEAGDIKKAMELQRML